MDTSTIKAIKGTAAALGSATKHIGAATYDVGRIVVPVAGAALGNVPKAAVATLETARKGETSEERKHAAMTLGVGVAIVCGLGVATYAHFASKFRKSRVYRQQKRQMKDAIAQEREIDDTLAEAYAIRSARDVANNNADIEEFGSEPGCFAIFTYDMDSNPNELDFAAYRDVYVGSASSMLEGVKEQLDGNGNLYVHADMVYKRPMYVAFYPCDQDELSSLQTELIIAFGADESYNRLPSMAEGE